MSGNSLIKLCVFFSGLVSRRAFAFYDWSAKRGPVFFVGVQLIMKPCVCVIPSFIEKKVGFGVL